MHNHPTYICPTYMCSVLNPTCVVSCTYAQSSNIYMSNLHVFSFESHLCCILDMHNHPTYICPTYMCSVLNPTCVVSCTYAQSSNIYMSNLHVFSFESHLCRILHICTIIQHIYVQPTCVQF